MKSGWIVRHDFAGTKKVYQVYRLINATQPDTEQNREIRDTLSSRDEALRVAMDLNREAAERFWRGEQE